MTKHWAKRNWPQTAEVTTQCATTDSDPIFTAQRRMVDCPGCLAVLARREQLADAKVAQAMRDSNPNADMIDAAFPLN
jgi:hypothetical protein